MDKFEISWETIEFCAAMLGQIQWGNVKRRSAACADLGKAMGNRQMTTSLECFQNAPWEVTVKRKDSR